LCVFFTLEGDMTDEPRHLKLLHGNVLTLPPSERTRFGRALAEDANTVSDDELTRLLAGDWRSQLTAAWLAGVARRTRHRHRIGELLLASKVTYAGQGFCFAFARFGGQEDAATLGAYLDRYLPQAHLRYDQNWAVGALLHLGVPLGDRESAWREWAGQQHLSPDPDEHRRFMEKLCVFADKSAAVGQWDA
jgi:hypothetical protein